MQYQSAVTPEVALRLLRDAGGDAKVVSGGTNVVPNLRERIIQPKLLIDINRIPSFRGISAKIDSIQLKPNCTISDLIRSPELTDGASLLPLAAEWFGGPSIRNRATIAGNIVDASPAADITVPLLALDAEIEVSRSDQAPRLIPIRQFLIGPHQTRLLPDELVTAIRIQRFRGARVAYYKYARRDSLAISIVSLAVLVELSGSVCRRARIAVGAASPVPYRAIQAEEALQGEQFSATNISQAARLAREEARPISDIRGSAAYRLELVEVLLRRLLEQLAG
jgi:CO/xanthine dehydrogenase FAD-binding subunit